MFLVLHVLGYCAVAFVLTSTVIERSKRVRAARRIESAEDRLARIARLEIATGLGLDVGREWLLERPIAAKSPGMQRLADEGNCAVERKCWACEKVYTPAHEDEYGASIYGARQREDGRQVMRERLCASCFDGALTQLERL